MRRNKGEFGELTISMTVGELIKKRRLELNLKRDDLATAVGVSYAQIARYEAGENLPTADMIVILARLLQVSADWLLGTTEVIGMDTLTDIEREALKILRTKTPENQKMMVEILRSMARLS